MAARERGLQARALSQADLVVARLREAVDSPEESGVFGPNRLKAIQILAQVSGLMRTDLHVTQEDKRDSETIMADLEMKLISLGIAPENEAESDSETADDGAAESLPAPGAPVH